jgi:hypothetical protein
VRYTAAMKVEPQQLSVLSDDPEPDVRELVEKRLNSIINQESRHE